jgi:hypothetical protein
MDTLLAEGVPGTGLPDGERLCRELATYPAADAKRSRPAYERTPEGRQATEAVHGLRTHVQNPPAPDDSQT